KEYPFGDSALRLRRYRLGNGLTVLVLADPSAPVISYHTWYRVGSRHEKKGKTGLAHLFEHLMFNETRNLPHGEFDRRVEAAGGDTNAATWTDWTQYHSELPASELPLIVELEADRMANLVLREPQVSSEKEVVANERRYRVDDDVEGTVHEVLYKLAYRRHPYHHPTIGWMRDIQGFTTADCSKFYRTYYAPNNATLVVVGDVDEAKLLSLIQRHYGGMKRARIPAEQVVKEGPPRSERVETLRLPTPTEKLAMGYRAPAFGERDYVALSILNELLFIGRSARCFQSMVRNAQVATDVAAGIAPFEHPGLYDIWVDLREGKRARQALKLLDAELKRVREEPVSEDDLRRVKSRAELGFLMAMETASGKAEQLGLYEVVLGDGSQLLTRLQEYREITAAEVQRVARRVLDPGGRVRIHVLPDDAAERGAA
ncbi:MAG: pitrilysin family protein, partial [Myxococcales bacterium]